MTFDIIELNPTVEALKELATKYQSLTINGIDDKIWYEAVKKARIELKNTRVEIKKKWMELRDDANKYAKAVIEKEKELIGYIEPMEDELKEKEDKYNELVAIEKRKEQLQSRIDRLSEIWLTLQDEDILKFDDQQFYDFIQEQKAIILKKKEDEILERERLMKEKEEALEKQKREEEIRKEAEEKARIEAEEKAKRDAELAEQKHQAELKRIKDEAEAKILADKLAKEAEEKRQAEEDEKAKKNETYKKWLADNNFDATKDKVERDGQKFTIYRFISEITL